MLSINEINILGNILNTSWGRSSNDAYNCKATLEGNRINVMYSTTAYFASEKDMHFQQARLAEESAVRLAEMISRSKDQFKDAAGVALKLNELSDNDSLELVNASMNNPRRVFVYRRKAVFEILNGSK